MFEQAFKNIDDVIWKDAACTSEPPGSSSSNTSPPSTTVSCGNEPLFALLSNVTLDQP